MSETSSEALAHRAARWLSELVESSDGSASERFNLLRSKMQMAGSWDEFEGWLVSFGKLQFDPDMLDAKADSDEQSAREVPGRDAFEADGLPGRDQ